VSPLVLVPVGLVLLIHVYIVVLEMVLWKSRAHKAFPITKEFAEQSAGLASNQGLYNGFLVAALAVGLLHPDPRLAHAFLLYGLICVAVAGVWGAITVHPRIALIQTVPAGLGLAALLLT
jgi:putative membrane protein